MSPDFSKAFEQFHLAAKQMGSQWKKFVQLLPNYEYTRRYRTRGRTGYAQRGSRRKR